MFKNILVIFENERVCDHAVKYSCELARRMDSNVTFLMLMEMSFPNRLSIDSQRKSIQKIESRISRTLGDMSSELLKQGIPVSVAIRVGDAWLAKVAGTLEGPLIAAGSQKIADEGG
jgi:hypothetical protein